jgi:glycosyltransferase involved in cell wall biosynthesis
LRIGFVVYPSLERLSGGYIYNHRVIDHLRARGDEVEVVVIDWRGYPWSLLDAWNRGLRRRLLAPGYDLLLQDEFTHLSLFALNRRLDGLPAVGVVHHLLCEDDYPAPARRLFRLFEAAYLRGVSAFVSTSDAARRAVVDMLGFERRSLVAHPGRDRLGPRCHAAEVEARARAPGPLRVLYVGNVIRRKRLLDLLRALRRLPSGAWRLDVAGSLEKEPRYASRVRRRARQADLEGSVAFHGVLPDADLAALYARSHVLALPSRHEAFGIVYLEGMGFGLPAIASASGGAGELVEEARDGFLVHAGDLETLALRLATLADDRGLLVEMGLAALAKHGGWPTWDETCSRVGDFLHALVPR